MECEKCGIIGTGKDMNWANISGKYTREREDWIRLCPSCHRIFDNICKRYAKFTGKEEEWQTQTPRINS